MKLRFFVAIGFLMICMAVPTAFAQESRFDVFIGYSLLRTGEYDNVESIKESLEDELWWELDIDANLKKSRFLEKGFVATGTYNFNAIVGLDTSFRFNTGYILSGSGKERDVYYGDTYEYEYGYKKSRIAFLAGPRFTLRSFNRHVNPFVYALAGLSNDRLLSASDHKWKYGDESESDSESETLKSHNSLGFAVGGGLDVLLSENLSIRAIQADYFIANHPKDMSVAGVEVENKLFSDVNLSFGLVFRFGK